MSARRPPSVGQKPPVQTQHRFAPWPLSLERLVRVWSALWITLVLAFTGCVFACSFLDCSCVLWLTCSCLGRAVGITVKGDAAGGGDVAGEEPEVLDEPVEPRPLTFEPFVIA